MHKGLKRFFLILLHTISSLLINPYFYFYSSINPFPEPYVIRHRYLSCPLQNILLSIHKNDVRF